MTKILLHMNKLSLNRDAVRNSSGDQLSLEDDEDLVSSQLSLVCLLLLIQDNEQFREVWSVWHKKSIKWRKSVPTKNVSHF